MMLRQKMSKRDKEDCGGSFVFNQCNILSAPLIPPEFHNALKLCELDGRGKHRMCPRLGGGGPSGKRNPVDLKGARQRASEGGRMEEGDESNGDWQNTTPRDYARGAPATHGAHPPLCKSRYGMRHAESSRRRGAKSSSQFPRAARKVPVFRERLIVAKTRPLPRMPLASPVCLRRTLTFH